jgi:hypothetical protein
VTWTIIVLAVLALVIWGFYVSWRASRLDRLHNRVESARTALDLALLRRSAAAAELGSSGLLDPATSLLLGDAVRRARQAGPADRDLAESDLTRALRATLGESGFRGGLQAGHALAGAAPDVAGPVTAGPVTAGTKGRDGTAGSAGPGGLAGIEDLDTATELEDAAELLDEVERAAHQVFIARKFYNDVAGRTIDARRRPLARVLRLSGSAPQPEFFDMDDALADGD